jgi:hypothetical protein
MSNTATIAALGALALAAVLFLPLPARGELLPGQPSFCLVNSAFGEPTFVSDYARSNQCFLGLEQMYRDTLKNEARDLIAGVTHWALGFNLDLRFVNRITEKLGITGKDKGMVEIRAQNGDGQSASTTRRSFFMKASRKQIFVGFNMEW